MGRFTMRECPCCGSRKDWEKSIKIGRFRLTLMNRMSDDGEKFFDYASWCFPSETFFIGKYEINIQNRRLMWPWRK